MAAAHLLRSLARKKARAVPAHHHPLLARGGLHGSQPPPPAAGLGSLATKVARAPPPPHLHAQRGLHSLNSTPPTSKLDGAKIRYGIAYVALFGSLAYLYGSLLPRMKRLEAIVEAQKQSKLAIDASTDGPDTAAQSSGRGNQADIKTRYKELDAKISEIERKLAAQKDKHD